MYKNKSQMMKHPRKGNEEPRISSRTPSIANDRNWKRDAGQNAEQPSRKQLQDPRPKAASKPSFAVELETGRPQKHTLNLKDLTSTKSKQSALYQFHLQDAASSKKTGKQLKHNAETGNMLLTNAQSLVSTQSVPSSNTRASKIESNNLSFRPHTNMQIHEESTEVSKDVNTGRHTSHGSPAPESRQHSPRHMQYKTYYNTSKANQIRK